MRSRGGGRGGGVDGSVGDASAAGVLAVALERRRSVQLWPPPPCLIVWKTVA